ncbi:MAG TPA: ribosome biogenesis GTPase Der [Polyangia bacterium]|jgi:GTP-binding protein|nr:ribosome biogenesis GTPase Der [Polyangia bacterium]
MKSAKPRRRPAPSSHDDPSLPLVALIGRPNVGKSSLFNRLVGGRPALVEDMPGVTRDRRYGVAEWGPARFRVVDTGGLDPSAEGILKAMRRQTLRAVDEAQVLVLVLDAVEGVTAVDGDVAQAMRRVGKPVIVAANKVDSGKREAAAAEIFTLGFPEVHLISAVHGRGTGDLCDAIVAALGPAALRRESAASDDALGAAIEAAQSDEAVGEGEGEGEDAGEGEGEGTAKKANDAPAGPLRLAFVGKPNVGKSSLVNRLLGEERVLVHDMPGTTRDPIDTPFRFGGREYVLVDTAGLRRRRSIDTLTEHVAAKMSRDQLERCDVAALVIDAREGATAEDAKLASLIEASGRAALLVLNKKDLVSRSEIDKKLESTREQLAFMRYAPVVLTSAATGAGVTEIPTAAHRILGEASRRISTGQLNKLLEDIVATHPPPSGPAGRHVRLYYATQTDVRPPTFVVSTNQPDDIGPAYLRFLTNQLRKAYGFEGTPIRIVLRARRKKQKLKPAAAKD